MINVFPACEAIYESHPVLRKTGRILAQGTVSKEHPQATTLNGVMVEDLSTFGGLGTGLDVEVWELTFELTSDSFRPDAAARWVQAMRDAFHTANIIDPVFVTAGCQVIDQVGPINEDEQFKAAVLVSLTIQQDTLIPLTRHG